MVYNLHMRLEALSKSIMFYDMDDVFKIPPNETVTIPEEKLKTNFNTQALITSSSDILANNSDNATFNADLEKLVTVCAAEVTLLESISLSPINISKSCKEVEEDVVRTSNQYYAQYDKEHCQCNGRDRQTVQ